MENQVYNFIGRMVADNFFNYVSAQLNNCDIVVVVGSSPDLNSAITVKQDIEKYSKTHNSLIWLSSATKNTENYKISYNQGFEVVTIINDKMLGFLKNNFRVCIIVPSDYFLQIVPRLRQHDLNVIDYTCQKFDVWHQDYRAFLKNAIHLKAIYEMFHDDRSREVMFGLLEAKIISKRQMLIKPLTEHYWHPEVHPEIDDVIIDIGAFTGDTMSFFMKKLKGKCLIHAFEPNPDAFEQLFNTINSNSWENSCIAVNTGIGSGNGILHINGKMVTDENGPGINIEIEKLDDYVSNRKIKVDCIKMDIEGAELDALKGSLQVIQKYKPKLMISIYHSVEQAFAIPLFIKEINPEYRFYLDHHELTWRGSEVVLYAI